MKMKDCCIGYAVKGWLTLVWLFILLSGAKVLGQEPKFDHVKTATCIIGHNAQFTVYTMKQHVTYSDAPPFDALIEEDPDQRTIFAECKAFMSAMLEASIDEQIREKMAEFAKAKDDHYFLRAKK